jgi:isopenicillin-N N-acyltransferase-like protein
MPHASYFEVAVKDNRELGLALGKKFGENLRQKLDESAGSPDWAAQIAAGISYLTFTETVFPQYIQELKGYAEGAGVPFEALWALSLEDELWGVEAEKCTSVVTNRGKLIGHTEDWLKDSQDDLSVLKKTVGGLTVLELYYRYTLGGQAASINSHGVVQLVSTLTHAGHQIGIPRNVIARWLADSADPAGDIEKLAKLRRSLGYGHTLVEQTGELWSVECTAKEQLATRPKIPYVHTNHYLTELRKAEAKIGRAHV